jgi:HAMP domain-containing protein
MQSRAKDTVQPIDLKCLRWRGVWLPTVGFAVALLVEGALETDPNSDWHEPMLAVHGLMIAAIAVGMYLFSNWMFGIIRQDREGILAISRPVGESASRVPIGHLHDHLQRVLANLRDIQDLARGEILQQATLGQSVRRKAWLIFGLVIAVGLAAAGLIGTAMARSILHPLRELQTAAGRFGADNLTARTAPDRGDELLELGTSVKAMAERIRDLIASQMIPVASERVVPLTVSIGVADFPEDTASEGQLISLAEQALDAAKRAGRNCVSRWEASAEAE